MNRGCTFWWENTFLVIRYPREPMHTLPWCVKSGGKIQVLWEVTGGVMSSQVTIYLRPDGRTEVPEDCGSALGCTFRWWGWGPRTPSCMLGGGGRGVTHPCRDTSAQAVNTSIYSTQGLRTCETVALSWPSSWGLAPVCYLRRWAGY